MTTIKQVGNVRVFADRGRSRGQEANPYVCYSGRRTSYALRDRSDFTIDDIVVTAVEGPYVLFSTWWNSGAPGDHGGYFQVLDSRSGALQRAGSTAFGGFDAPIRIARTGQIVLLRSRPDADDQIVTIGRTQRVIGEGPRLSALRIVNRDAVWKDDSGTEHRAALAPRPPYRDRARAVVFRRR